MPTPLSDAASTNARSYSIGPARAGSAADLVGEDKFLTQPAIRLLLVSPQHRVSGRQLRRRQLAAGQSWRVVVPSQGP